MMIYRRRGIQAEMRPLPECQGGNVDMMSRHSRARAFGPHVLATLGAVVMGLTFLTTACEGPSKGSAWRERPDSVGYRTITGVESACATCIELSPMATLGTEKGDGFLEDRGPSLGRVVRDRQGRYWVAQRGAVKVYAPNGDFVATVGRPGQGPLEFEFAEPIQVDASGMVHVIDVRLGRETIVRPDFTRHSDHKIEGQFSEIAAFPGDGNRYVIAKWIATPERLGLPLHVVSGMDVLRSFGLTPRADTSAVTQAKSPRRIAVTADGYVLSSMVDEYLVEAWTKDGTRIAGFELPGLNASVVRPGVWAMDNPPPNFVGDIAPYDDRHVVVITRHRRTNWKDLVVEKVTGDGTPYLDASDGHIPSIYRSRIDVLDLNTALIVASTWHDGYLLRMIERDVIARLDYNSDGAPVVAVLKMTLRVP